MKRPSVEDTVLLALASTAFFSYLLTIEGYGYFRDELYYLACGEHLGWGYVDHPPMIGWIAALVRTLLGTSLVAIRLLPALAAAVTVWVTGRMARDLGGGAFAQGLAGLTAMLAPVYLSLFSTFSMNSFEVLCWAVLWWLLVRILGAAPETDRAQPSAVEAVKSLAQPSAVEAVKSWDHSWLVFGAVAGFGMLNKISVLFVGVGLAAGLVLSRRWRILRNPWLWIGGALAGVIFLPHVLWQVANDWPTLEFMENARERKMLALSPLDFVSQQVLQVGPLSLPVWLSGLGFFLFAAKARSFRALGWAYLTILTMMILTHAKAYYLAPAYTVLFAGGAVAIESWTASWRFARVIRAAAILVVTAGGLLTAPLAKPLLPVESYVRYAASLGVEASSGERHELGRLPQFFADMFGWRELAVTVAGVHRNLPPGDREQACVFGQNYGHAGAIDLFGPAYGLPKAISSHNSYHLWGPRGCTGEVVIVIGVEREELEPIFLDLELAATFTCEDCMPHENGSPIWIARGLRRPFEEIWPEIGSYI